MKQLFGALLKAVLPRLGRIFWRGASVKTAHYEIHDATTEGVVTIMRELRDMASERPLPRLRKRDSLPGTVQAEEPMTVKG